MKTTVAREPWNKGKLVGQKAPLRLRDIWSIRVRLQIAEKIGFYPANTDTFK